MDKLIIDIILNNHSVIIKASWWMMKYKQCYKVNDPVQFSVEPEPKHEVGGACK